MLLSALLTTALAAPPAVDVTEVALGTGTGILFVPLAPLEEAWAENGWARFAPVQLATLAVNGELYINRHVPGFDHIEYSSVGDRIQGGDVRTDLRITMDQLSYGYAAVDRRGWFVVPRLGVGLLNATATATPLTTVPFDQASADGLRALPMSTSAFYLDAGVGLYYLVAFGGRDALGIRQGLRIGLRLGALVELFHTSGGDSLWTVQGQPLPGAPDVFLGGPYVRLFVSPSLIHRAPHVTVRKPKVAPPEG